MDLIIDKFDDNLKLREFAARHHIPAVSDISSPKLKYLVTERNEQFLFKDLRRKKAHFFSLDLKPMNIDKIFKNISTDTRILSKGDIFLALGGSNYDGHDFINEAFDLSLIHI